MCWKFFFFFFVSSSRVSRTRPEVAQNVLDTKFNQKISDVSVESDKGLSKLPDSGSSQDFKRVASNVGDTKKQYVTTTSLSKKMIRADFFSFLFVYLFVKREITRSFPLLSDEKNVLDKQVEQKMASASVQNVKGPSILSDSASTQESRLVDSIHTHEKKWVTTFTWTSITKKKCWNGSHLFLCISPQTHHWIWNDDQ